MRTRLSLEREREICLFASNLFNKLPLKTQKTRVLHFEIKQTDNKPHISNQRALLRCDAINKFTLRHGLH